MIPDPRPRPGGLFERWYTARAMNARSFVDGLTEEMETLFAQLGARETLESESDGRVDVPTLLRLALKSELEASELAGSWLPSTPELEAKRLFAEQCGEEMKHYSLIVERLQELGEDLSSFEPMANGYSPLYQYLQTLRTTVERVAGGPFALEAIAKVRNRQFIDFCRSVGDEGTARLYVEVIQPEEVKHHELGRAFLARHCSTPEQQAAASAATRNALAIADELQTLARKRSGMHPIPSS